MLNHLWPLKIRYRHRADIHLAFCRLADWLRPYLLAFPRLITSN